MRWGWNGAYSVRAVPGASSSAPDWKVVGGSSQGREGQWEWEWVIVVQGLVLCEAVGVYRSGVEEGTAGAARFGPPPRIRPTRPIPHPLHTASHLPGPTPPYPLPPPLPRPPVVCKKRGPSSFTFQRPRGRRNSLPQPSLPKSPSRSRWEKMDGVGDGPVLPSFLHQDIVPPQAARIKEYPSCINSSSLHLPDLKSGGDKVELLPSWRAGIISR